MLIENVGNTFRRKIIQKFGNTPLVSMTTKNFSFGCLHWMCCRSDTQIDVRFWQS